TSTIHTRGYHVKRTRGQRIVAVASWRILSPHTSLTKRMARLYPKLLLSQLLSAVQISMCIGSSSLEKTILS
ncbi:hypothetical protein P692DRAFT_20490041, partial [Suillus brevipes Sb2]